MMHDEKTHKKMANLMGGKGAKNPRTSAAAMGKSKSGKKKFQKMTIGGK